jgi:putative endonuclease
MKQYFVYILASITRTIYIGMTNDIDRRLYEHKNKLAEGFTSKYGVDRLVYFEQFNDVKLAIARETELKKWRREKKIALIESVNPDWDDITAKWGE